MVDLGFYSLLFTLPLCAYACAVGILGGVSRRSPWIRSAENAVIANCGIVLAAVVSLWQLILSDQFQVAYVANVSSTTIPLIYKVTALWGGQAGSLLFWLAILSVLSAILVAQNRRRNRNIMPWVTVVLSGTLLFFSVLVNVNSNPFKLLELAPADGTGLNPLLQNYWMAIHPPVLYLGLISVSIPFALAMGALLSRCTDTSWIPTTRRWSLFSFSFLTLGFTLGGIWAYEELGWGGYWAWDPVENASFMPWLAMTAFLHSVMITEKKGMLKTWNFVLILLAFELTIFGTFITRSGVIQSVHSFALSNIGNYFVVFLGISSVFALGLLYFNSKELSSEGKMRSFLSREASFLLNNWLFLGICFAVFWGTVFPMVNEIVTGRKISHASTWFNERIWPMGLALLVLTGICPLIAWRKASTRNFRRNFLYPLTVGVLTGTAALAWGIRDWIPLSFFSAAGFVMATLYLEFYKGAKARQAIRPSGFVTALADLTLRNKRRYGGFIIHAGVVLVFVGIVASSFFQLEEVFTVRAGQSFSIAGYELKFLGLEGKRDAEKDAVYAWLEGYRGGERLGLFYPQSHHHFKQDQTVSEVAVRSSWRDDLYLVLQGWDEQGNVSLRVFVNPLVNLIWIGIGIMFFGGLFVMLPNRGARLTSLTSREESAVAEEAA